MRVVVRRLLHFVLVRPVLRGLQLATHRRELACLGAHAVFVMCRYLFGGDKVRKSGRGVGVFGSGRECVRRRRYLRSGGG
jgi:hypothetical protein